MKRKEALQFIKDNSRCVTQMIGNPVKKSDQWEGYHPIYFEQRLGNNGVPFVLQDAGPDGWDIYFINAGNNVMDALTKFIQVTGAEPLRLEEQAKIATD